MKLNWNFQRHELGGAKQTNFCGAGTLTSLQKKGKYNFIYFFLFFHRNKED